MSLCKTNRVLQQAQYSPKKLRITPALISICIIHGLYDTLTVMNAPGETLETFFTYLNVSNIDSFFCILILLTGFLISMVLLITAFFGTNLKQPVHRWFFIVALFFLLVITAEILGKILEARTGTAANVMLHAATFFTYVSAGFIMFSLSKYFYELLKQKTVIKKRFILVVSFLGAFQSLTAIVNLFVPLYYYFDANNIYHEMETIWIAVIFQLISFIVLLLVVIYHRKALKRREFGSMIFYCAVMLICFFLDAFVLKYIWVSYLGGSIMFLAIFINIQLELKHTLREQQAEIAKKQVEIMMSQIKPHFFYSSMLSIQQLCLEDPKAASKAMEDFSLYLRGNIDSLSITNPIPFEDELRHAEHYLALEKQRFDYKLRIVYDIKVRDFLLPALSLQPIVENAVRHGVTRRSKGGTVSISTAETEHEYTITVTDDGVGFDIHQFQQDGRVHVGIKNVRSRLVSMYGGTLVIHSKPGFGTTAVITIPKGGTT